MQSSRTKTQISSYFIALNNIHSTQQTLVWSFMQVKTGLNYKYVLNTLWCWTLMMMILYSNKGFIPFGLFKYNGSV